MNRRAVILAAAGLGLGLPAPAHAQLALDWIDTPPPGDAPTRRMEDQAAHMAKYDLAEHPHIVSFDYVYPTDPHEYEALGGNGLLLVSTVAKDPKELPVKQVVLRFGVKDLALQPIADHASTVSPGSSLAKDIGVNREDAFFLLPGVLPGKAADLVVVFALPGRQFKAGRLSPVLPDSLKVFVKPPAGQPKAAALKAMLAREYPGLVRP
jgi:hypothetical protein